MGIFNPEILGLFIRIGAAVSITNAGITKAEAIRLKSMTYVSEDVNKTLAKNLTFKSIFPTHSQHAGKASVLSFRLSTHN